MVAQRIAIQDNLQTWPSPYAVPVLCAIATFSMAYADQNERDHAALDRAVRTGKVPAVLEER